MNKVLRSASGCLPKDPVVYAAGLPPLLVTFFAALICRFGKLEWFPFADQINQNYLCRCNESIMWAITVAALLIAIYLCCQIRKKESLGRMRHAIAILGLLGLAIASASIYGWSWLNSGDDSNSGTIRNIALGIAAILTLVFVVWRERIASGTATFDRYESAVQMLGDPSVATCIAGIRIIRDLGRYPGYRTMGLPVLRAFVQDPTPSRPDETKRSRQAAVDEANHAIDALSKEQPAQCKDRTPDGEAELKES